MNFFKNYFYGKSSRKDFTENDLPANRKELFWTVLSVRRGSMVGLNLLYLLFWLPAVFWTFLNAMQLGAVAEGNLDAGNLLYSYLLVLFPLVAFTGPFTMGIARVMRNWARDEHSFAFSDFRKGVKENWRQGLLLGVINGGLPLLLFVCIDVYSTLAKGSLLMYLPIGILLVAALLWVLSAQLLPTMIVTYRQGFFAMVRNAVLMTLAELPRAVLAKLATLVVPILLLVCMFIPMVGQWAMLVAAILYVLFQLSFNKLITASYANALCEKYLNTKIEGAGVDIGLRKREP